MPTTKNRILRLDPKATGEVDIIFTYQVVFLPFERHLAELGMRYFETVDVIGVDPPGSTTGEVLTNLSSNTILLVTAGTGPLTLSRSFFKTVSRIVLDEDPTGGPLFSNPDLDEDEIRCRIQITARPTFNVTAFSNQEVIGGLIVNPASAEAQSTEDTLSG